MTDTAVPSQKGLCTHTTILTTGMQLRHKIYHTPLELWNSWLVNHSINADSICLCDIAYHKSEFISLSELPTQPRNIQLATILTSVSPYN